MTADSFLLLFIVAIFTLTIYGIMTNPITPEERDEMLKEDSWF